MLHKTLHNLHKALRCASPKLQSRIPSTARYSWTSSTSCMSSGQSTPASDVRWAGNASSTLRQNTDLPPYIQKLKPCFESVHMHGIRNKSHIQHPNPNFHYAHYVAQHNCYAATMTNNYSLYRVAQNKIPHQTIRNVFATSFQIFKILEAV